MKNSLRRIYIKKRKKCSPDFIEKAGEGIAEKFLSSHLLNKKSYMIYYPINNEAPVMNLAKRLFERGKILTFPVTTEDDSIKPAQLIDFSNFSEGKYKIPEPEDKNFINPNQIEIVFVPGVVFDRSGGRAGYGKGCYDRFLERSAAVKIGVCYEFQIHKTQLVMEQHDIRMDYLLTEEGLYEV